jgi:hypothetical protein
MIGYLFFIGIVIMRIAGATVAASWLFNRVNYNSLGYQHQYLFGYVLRPCRHRTAYQLDEQL